MESCRRIVSELIVLCLNLCVLLSQVQHGHLVVGDGDEVLDTGLDQGLDLVSNLERSSRSKISLSSVNMKLPIQEELISRGFPYFMDYWNLLREVFPISWFTGIFCERDYWIGNITHIQCHWMLPLFQTSCYCYSVYPFPSYQLRRSCTG